MKKINLFKLNFKKKKILLTNKALKYIKFLYKKEKKILKLSIKKIGCKGYKYYMKFILKKKNNLEFKNSNLIILISKKNLSFIKNTIIDYESNDLIKKFKFYNKKIKKFCNCGESFKINNYEKKKH